MAHHTLLWSKKINLDLKKVNSILGIAIKNNEAAKILKTLEFSVAGKNNSIKITAVPNWSFASVITAFGLLVGIYLGLGIWENGTTQEDIDFLSDALGANAP